MNDQQKKDYSVLVNQLIEKYSEGESSEVLDFLSILESNSAWIEPELLVLSLYRLEAERKSKHHLIDSKKLRAIRHFLITNFTSSREAAICLPLSLKLINCSSEDELPILLKYKKFINFSLAALMEMLLDELISSSDLFRKYFPEFLKSLEESSASQIEKNFIWNELLGGVKIFLQEKGLGISIIAQAVSFSEQDLLAEHYIILDHLVRVSALEDGNPEKLLPILEEFYYIFDENFSKVIKNWYELFLDFTPLGLDDDYFLDEDLNESSKSISLIKEGFSTALIDLCSIIGTIRTDTDTDIEQLTEIMITAYETVADSYEKFEDNREASSLIRKLAIRLEEIPLSLDNKYRRSAVKNLVSKLQAKSFELLSRFYNQNQIRQNALSPMIATMGGGMEEDYPASSLHFGWMENVLRPISWWLLPKYIDIYDTNDTNDTEEIITACIRNLSKHLALYPRDKFPEMWAAIKANFGFACHYRNDTLYRNGAAYWIDSIEAADSYKEALEIYKPNTHPVECLILGTNLGDLGFSERNLDNLLQGYKVVVDSIEQGRNLSSFEFRKDILEHCISAYSKLIQGYVIANEPRKAIEYVELSKTRSLTEALFGIHYYPKNANREICEKLDLLRRDISLIQKRIEHKKYSVNAEKLDLEIDYLNLEKSKDELNKFVQQHIHKIDPSFDISPKFPRISYEEIKAIIPDNRTAIIEWYLTNRKIFAFIITQDYEIYTWQSSIYAEEDILYLSNLKKQTKDWKISEQISEQISNVFGNLSEINNNVYQKNKKFWDSIKKYAQDYQDDFSFWKSNLESSLDSIAEMLGINEILARPEISGCDRLILVPHRHLHLIALHALPTTDGRLLINHFDRGISYAPSCQILQFAHKENNTRRLDHLFAVQNPTDDLIHSDLEVEAIKTLFLSSSVLKKQEATRINLLKNASLASANCGHFSCHALFRFKSPLDSSFVLAGNDSFSLKDIFELNLSNLRLITLSACESGMIDSDNDSDEYIGLSNAFLHSGCPSLITSLWAVNDFASTLLMVKFYRDLTQIESLKEGDISRILCQTQQWLRSLTVEQLDAEIEILMPCLKDTLNQLRPGQKILFRDSLEKSRQRKPYPFANPYYWAGFVAIGF